MGDGVLLPKNSSAVWDRREVCLGLKFVLVVHLKFNVMQLRSMFINNCNDTLHVSDVFCVHPRQHLKTEVAASGV